MKKKIFLLFLPLLCSFFRAEAQTKPPSQAAIKEAEQLMQRFFSASGQDMDESVLENLYQYLESPIELNTAAESDWAALGLLPPLLAHSLKNHIALNGPLLSLYELQAVEGFDEADIRALLPFVSLRETKDSRRLAQRIAEEKDGHYLLLRTSRTLQAQEGYTRTEGGYWGAPYKTYLKYRLSKPKDFSFGFLAEKDAGERLALDKKQKGADFYSAHAFLYGFRNSKKLALGDYQVQGGQGLILSGGFQLGKGAETVLNVRKAESGLRPYGSAMEAGFLRGAAATFGIRNLDLTLFASARRLDAALDSSDNGISASSVLESGLHRTLSEISRKKTLGQITAGGRLYAPKLGLGVTALGSRFSFPINENPNYYNQFDFQGKYNYNLGFDWDRRRKNWSFFGEGALSKQGGAFLAGLAGNLGRYWETALLLRAYGKGFHAFYGQAFGENSRNQNERGLYMGLKGKIGQKLYVSAYHDLFTFPWLKFGLRSLSGGDDTFVKLQYKISKQASVYAQAKWEGKGAGFMEEGAKTVSSLWSHKQSGQLVAEKTAGRFWVKSRLQGSRHVLAGKVSTGIVFAQDLGCEWDKLKISTRFAVFDTDDYENRQYLYEKNVLYAFSMPAYYGEGYRNYWLLQWKPLPRVDVWARFAYTYLPGAKSIGSALETVKGEIKSELTVQVRVGL